MIYSLHNCAKEYEALAVMLLCATKYRDQSPGKYHSILTPSYMVWRTKMGWHISEVGEPCARRIPVSHLGIANSLDN